MGCLRVEKILDHLIEPLKKALQDQDSYVKKAAVLCVCKLYDQNPEYIAQIGLVNYVESLIDDGNQLVVMNALVCLQQI